MAEISKLEIAGVIRTFGGDAKVFPDHIRWLMEEYGSIPMIHFLENKQSLGREEAEKLLQLKNRRGGPQQLNALQQTIKGLLGVHIDAFKEGDQSPAEMDVDQFLVEANGAGVREALRIVLDLELRSPRLVLIEEPEVHLHPGLARVVANYLRQKSAEIQMFVTTHSTEFVDSVAFQNAYLVSRNDCGMTVCQLVEAEEEALRIPTELGLRLSTVFMFDRLVFVEGPSDEAVLRIFAEKLGIDLASSNIGFVHMGGVRNFAHFAAQSTLDLLSRRQVSMWFVTDRDESEDEEVRNMKARLGPRARLKVLGRRELENYLCDEEALAKFIYQKLQSSASKPTKELDRGAICAALEKAVEDSKADVVRLRIAKRILAPLYFGARTAGGTAEEKLAKGAEELNARLKDLDTEKTKIEAEVNSSWATDAAKLAPGAVVLDRAAQAFGVRFLKENGDSEKLARLIPATAISQDIRELLRELTAGGPS
jgi:putative ATP-dependent endonuclease of OLD family